MWELSKNKRKKIFVDRKVQGAMFRHIILHWGLLLVTTFVLLAFFNMGTKLRGDVGANLFQRHGPILLAMLALAPIFIRDLCKLSNRFVGPMARLRGALHDLANGREVAPIHFRKRDFWPEMATDFNRIAKQIQSTDTTFLDDTNLDELNESDEVRALETIEST